MCFVILFLSLSGVSAVAAASLAITNVTIIDGTGGPNIPKQTVLIEDGRIAAVLAACWWLPLTGPTARSTSASCNCWQSSVFPPPPSCAWALYTGHSFSAWKTISASLASASWQTWCCWRPTPPPTSVTPQRSPQ